MGVLTQHMFVQPVPPSQVSRRGARARRARRDHVALPREEARGALRLHGGARRRARRVVQLGGATGSSRSPSRLAPPPGRLRERPRYRMADELEPPTPREMRVGDRRRAAVDAQGALGGDRRGDRGCRGRAGAVAMGGAAGAWSATVRAATMAARGAAARTDAATGGRRPVDARRPTPASADSRPRRRRRSAARRARPRPLPRAAGAPSAAPASAGRPTEPRSPRASDDVRRPLRPQATSDGTDTSRLGRPTARPARDDWQGARRSTL